MPIGLYYPFIHFKSDDWLKLSALYWDRMARIVPPSYEAGQGAVLEKDSPAVRELASELDFVVNISPLGATYEVAGLFGDFIAQHAQQLREHYDIRASGRWPIDAMTGLYPGLRNPHLAYVNVDKMGSGLVRLFEEQSLGESLNDRGQWLGMHPRLAGVYMSALAEAIGATNALHPATDETLDHVAAVGWSLPRLAAALLGEPGFAPSAKDGPELELRASVAFLSFQVVVPKDMQTLSVAKIVKIRQRFQPELLRFQQLVDLAAKDLAALSTSTDPAAIAAHVEVAYQQHIKPQTDELRGALHDMGVETMLTAASTSIATPALLKVITLPDPIATGVAAALTIVGVLRAKHAKAKAVYGQSPAAYLYRLGEELTPHTLLQRVRQRAQQFLVGV